MTKPHVSLQLTPQLLLNDAMVLKEFYFLRSFPYYLSCFPSNLASSARKNDYKELKYLHLLCLLLSAVLRCSDQHPCTELTTYPSTNILLRNEHRLFQSIIPSQMSCGGCLRAWLYCWPGINHEVSNSELSLCDTSSSHKWGRLRSWTQRSAAYALMGGGQMTVVTQWCKNGTNAFRSTNELYYQAYKKAR